MTEVKIAWTEKNISEYMKYMTFGKGRGAKITIAALALCYVLIIAICIAGYVAFEYSFLITAAILVTVLLIAFGALFFIMIKINSKSVMKTNSDSELDSVIVTDIEIIVCKDGVPFGSISWDKITDIYLNDKGQAAYIAAEGDSMLILEYSNIKSGTKGELIDVLEKKQRLICENADGNKKKRKSK